MGLADVNPVGFFLVLVLILLLRVSTTGQNKILSLTTSTAFNVPSLIRSILPGPAGHVTAGGVVLPASLLILVLWQPFESICGECMPSLLQSKSKSYETLNR